MPCSPIKAKIAGGMAAATEQADSLREKRIPRSRGTHAGEHTLTAPVPRYAFLVLHTGEHTLTAPAPRTCSSRVFDPAPWILLLAAKHNRGGHRTLSIQHTKSSQGKCKQHCH